MSLVKLLKAPLWEDNIMLTCSSQKEIRDEMEMGTGASEIMGLGVSRPEAQEVLLAHIPSHECKALWA